MNNQSELTNFFLVYIGDNFESRDNKIWSEYVEISALDVNDGRTLETSSANIIRFNKRFARVSQPGSVVQINGSRKESRLSVQPDTARLIGRWKNDDNVTVWQASHHAASLAHAAHAKAAKETAKRLDLSLLSPIRDAYWKLNSRQRKALLVNVLHEITKAGYNA